MCGTSLQRYPWISEVRILDWNVDEEITERFSLVEM